MRAGTQLRPIVAVAMLSSVHAAPIAAPLLAPAAAKAAEAALIALAAALLTTGWTPAEVHVSPHSNRTRGLTLRLMPQTRCTHPSSTTRHTHPPLSAAQVIKRATAAAARGAYQVATAASVGTADARAMALEAAIATREQGAFSTLLSPPPFLSTCELTHTHAHMHARTHTNTTVPSARSDRCHEHSPQQRVLAVMLPESRAGLQVLQELQPIVTDVFKHMGGWDRTQKKVEERVWTELLEGAESPRVKDLRERLRANVEDRIAGNPYGDAPPSAGHDPTTSTFVDLGRREIGTLARDEHGERTSDWPELTDLLQEALDEPDFDYQQYDFDSEPNDPIPIDPPMTDPIDGRGGPALEPLPGVFTPGAGIFQPRTSGYDDLFRGRASTPAVGTAEAETDLAPISDVDLSEYIYDYMDDYNGGMEQEGAQGDGGNAGFKESRAQYGVQRARLSTDARRRSDPSGSGAAQSSAAGRSAAGDGAAGRYSAIIGAVSLGVAALVMGGVVGVRRRIRGRPALLKRRGVGGGRVRDGGGGVAAAAEMASRRVGVAASV